METGLTSCSGSLSSSLDIFSHHILSSDVEKDVFPRDVAFIKRFHFCAIHSIMKPWRIGSTRPWWTSLVSFNYKSNIARQLEAAYGRPAKSGKPRQDSWQSLHLYDVVTKMRHISSFVKVCRNRTINIIYEGMPHGVVGIHMLDRDECFNLHIIIYYLHAYYRIFGRLK